MNRLLLIISLFLPLACFAQKSVNTNGNQIVWGNKTFKDAVTNALIVVSNSVGRFSGNTNGRPFVTALGPGLGSAGNAMILTNANTSDTMFLLRLDPLTSSVANTNVCTIQFTTPFAVPPAVVVSIARATTNFVFTGTTSPTVNADASMTTTSNLTIVVNGTVLTSGGSYIYQVLVFGR